MDVALRPCGSLRFRKDASRFKVPYHDFFYGQSPGKYIRNGVRASKRKFVVTVAVSGHFAVLIDAVDIVYKADVRR